MPGKNKKLITLLTAALIAVSPILAQDEDDLDAMFLSEDPPAQDSQNSWEIFGYLESENFFGIAGDLGADDEIIKTEGRIRLNAKAGSDFFYGKAVFDAWFYPEGFGQAPVSSGTIDPYEFYIAGGETLQFKIGKQVFNWGSADAFRVSNHFGQRDLTELFMKEEDERYRGIYALDLKYLLGDFAIEAVIAPSFQPILLPDTASRWAIQPAPSNGITPFLDLSAAPPEGFGNIAYGLQAGGTLGTLDFHLSYYQGNDSAMVLVPQTVVALPALTPVSVTLFPDYHRVHKLGFDGAFTIEKLAIRTEAAFTLNRNALLADENANDTIKTGATSITLRRQMAEVPYLAYTAGVDYNLWGSNGRIIAEYSNGSFLKDADLYENDFFTNFLMIGLQDKWFDDKLDAKLNTILRLTTGAPGFMAGISLGYDFGNGLIVTTGALFFEGGDDEMMKIYANHDLAYLRATYHF